MFSYQDDCTDDWLRTLLHRTVKFNHLTTHTDSVSVSASIVCLSSSPRKVDEHFGVGNQMQPPETEWRQATRLSGPLSSPSLAVFQPKLEWIKRLDLTKHREMHFKSYASHNLKLSKFDERLKISQSQHMEDATSRILSFFLSFNPVTKVSRRCIL